MNTQGQGVVLLQKDKFQIFMSNQPGILEFLFVPEIVSDLDIIDKNFLEQLIKLFIDSNKLTPGALTFVIAEQACFIKNIVLPPPPAVHTEPNQVVNFDLEKEINQFLERVPFDEVASVRFQLENGARICATNKIFFESFVKAFEKYGFMTNIVVPSLALGSSPILKPILDQQMANYILSADLGALRRHSFMIDQKIEQQASVLDEKKSGNSSSGNYEISDAPSGPEKKTNKKRVFLLVSVFVILIAILVFMIFNQEPV